MYHLAPPEADLGYRTLLTAVAVPGYEQFVVGNVHGDPGAVGATSELLRDIVDHVAELGRPLALLGDFNLTPDQGYVAQALAGGWLHLPDSPEERLQPTRHPGRHIDYLLHHQALPTHARQR